MVALAALLLKIPQTKMVFAALNQGIDAVAAATRAGTAFVFGYRGGAPLPFDPKMPGGEYVLAFHALPIVLVVSVLTTLLFHWGVLQVVVRGFAWTLERTISVGGAVGYPPPPTSSSAWWRRRSSSAPIWRGCRAVRFSSP